MMDSTQTIIKNAKELFNYSASNLVNEYNELDEITRNGMIINDIVEANIHNRHMCLFVSRAIKNDLRDPELVRLYVQLAVEGISNSAQSYWLAEQITKIQKKVKDFNNWTIVTIYDNTPSVKDYMLMESGVYPLDDFINRDVPCQQYLCKANEPTDNRVNFYIMKYVSKHYQEQDITKILTRDLVLTGEKSQFNIIPRTSIIQDKFACYQGCVMYLDECHEDRVQDLLRFEDDIIYWYHNGYKIQCSIDNEFNMFKVNAKLDMIKSA